MTIRLNKVTRDLNVGITTVVEFLQKKGYTIEASPNAKITEEQYAVLVKEFSTDKNLKIESEKFSQERQNKDRNKASISIEGFESKKEKEEVVKTVIPEEARPKLKQVGKIDLDNLNKKTAPKVVEPVAKVIEQTPKAEPVVEKVVERKETPQPEKETPKPVVVEEKKPEPAPQPAPAPVLEEKKEPKIEKTEEKTPQVKEMEKETPEAAPVQEKEEDDVFKIRPTEFKSKINVVGQIDLAALNQSTRPKKKSKEEKRKEREEKDKQRQEQRKLMKDAIIKEIRKGDDKISKNSVNDDAAKKKKRNRINKERVDINAAGTAGVDAVKRFTQKMDYPNSVTFVGTGKLQEIKEYVVENEIGLVIFDDELSPKQLRNIEKELQVKILDRTSLILDIFASRAQTAHAKTQVELAQYKYMLPRLTRLWTHLERQRGGVGMRGPGETQLETDKRIILDKIARLKKELVDIDKQKSVQRKNRGKMVRVALVGYTNVGKSTLMNLLSKSEVFAENKLFATLDTTVRKVIIENLPFLLSDTVGFIRKLPTELVESFKSTLDEVREADLLVHIVDISHPTFEEQIEVVNRTLAEIDKTEKPMIMVFNKVDAFTFVPKEEDDLTPRGRENIDLDELKRTWMGKLQDNCIFISAKERTNIEALKEMLYERVKQIHITRFPYNDFLFQQYDEE